MPLYGQVTILREERKDDQKFLTALRNNMETQAWSQALPPDYTLSMYIDKYRERSFSYKRDMGRFVIEYKPTREPAGYISYSGEADRLSAGIGIMVDKNYWGQGVALDAQETLLRFLFMERGLRVVRLWTQSGNPRAVKLAEKSGFQMAVRQRERHFIGGKREDNLVMDLLREEWFERHPEFVDHLPPL